MHKRNKIRNNLVLNYNEVSQCRNAIYKEMNNGELKSNIKFNIIFIIISLLCCITVEALVYFKNLNFQHMYMLRVTLIMLFLIAEKIAYLWNEYNDTWFHLNDNKNFFKKFLKIECTLYLFSLILGAIIRFFLLYR